MWLHTCFSAKCSYLSAIKNGCSLYYIKHSFSCQPLFLDMCIFVHMLYYVQHQISIKHLLFLSESLKNVQKVIDELCRMWYNNINIPIYQT